MSKTDASADSLVSAHDPETKKGFFKSKSQNPKMLH